MFFFFKDTATTEIYTYVHTLSLHDALPICKEEFGKTPVWMIDITRAKACIHQNQPRVAFDQKAMANQMAEWPIRCPVEETAADGTACPTTQVMNTHGSAHMDTGSRRPHGCM